jgi:hypothetical protein
MATKTPLHVLVQKIQNKQITENEIAKFFTFAPRPEKPFDFKIGINTDAVDVSNVPSVQALAAPLLRDAGIILQIKRFPAARKRIARFRRKLPLIAEGDSWFKLPDLHPFVPRTLIDFLEAQLPTVNLAHWGDTLIDIISQGEFWPFLQSGSSDVFLFSAAGNDVLGGGKLSSLLNLFDPDHTQPKQASYYLKPEFYDNLNNVISKYEALIIAVEMRAPHVIMLGHGYDYAIPRRDGPWLGGPMTSLGIDPVFHLELSKAIIRLMIDLFNNRLKALEKAHSINFKYVDLRGSIKRDEWWDELHPLEVGAKKTAAKFSAAIRALPSPTKIVVSPLEEHFYRLVA